MLKTIISIEWWIFDSAEIIVRVEFKVWKLKNVSATHILRETNSGESKMWKSVIFDFF